MGEKEGKRLLAKRLYLELQIFRYSTLRKTKKEIYDASYKIELLVTIYEILLESMEYINEEMACRLLYWNGGILEFLYEEWLKKEDSTYGELKEHIGVELGTISGKGQNVCREETADGERIDQAA